MSRRLSFRVAEGGGDPVAREPDRHGNIPLIMVGTIALGWAAAVGAAWVAYAICCATGLVKS